jgi:LacI family transcriptional regulator
MNTHRNETRRRMPVRIEDVAQAAGVSMKTVSRVLNREPNVTEATRRRVEDAVNRLQYRPHPSARSLAGQRSFLVALFYDNPSGNYLMDVQSGMLEACHAHGYNLMLGPIDFDDRKSIAHVDEAIARSRVDGLVLTPPLTDHPGLIRRLDTLGIPYARVSPKRHGRGIGVFLDERGAVHELMAHLVSLGHRRIGHILGRGSHGAAQWRLDGYRDALDTAGIEFDPSLVVPGNFDYESGVAGANALLSLDEPPTAIFAANDDMAAGAISAVGERGLSVPRDISVCGFDDIAIARHIYPALTTIRQPTREMGRIATLELFKRLRDPADGGMQRVDFALVVRRSTGPAPARR